MWTPSFLLVVKRTAHALNFQKAATVNTAQCVLHIHSTLVKTTRIVSGTKFCQEWAKSEQQLVKGKLCRNFAPQKSEHMTPTPTFSKITGFQEPSIRENVFVLCFKDSFQGEGKCEVFEFVLKL